MLTLKNTCFFRAGRKTIMKITVSVSMIAIATVFSGEVAAQLDEIVVTAQKTEQTLQEVPVALSVIVL